VGFGSLLWITHLGLADHHAAEGFFAFLTLACMCAAVNQGNTRAAWLGGIALGLFLGTRPAGIFVPATLACLLLIEPAASAMVLRAVVAAAAVFLPSSGGLWTEYTWLALAATGALAGVVLVLDTVSRRRDWSPFARRSAPFVAMAAGLAAIVLANPHLFSSLWFEIMRVAGRKNASRIVSTVQEMQPLLRAGLRPGIQAVLWTVGLVWIAALPALFRLLTAPSRLAARLLALWTLVMAIGTVMQVRMAIYFLPPASVLAGAACVWLIERWSAARRRIVTVALAIVVLAINLPFAIHQTAADQAVNSDWIDALIWLRDHSPEPLGDAAAWSRWYPATEPGAGRAHGAWGVAVWWDKGYVLEQVSQRIPMSNGTQAGAENMARLYTEAIPEAAVGWLRRSGARYVVVDPQSPLFNGEYRSRFPVQVRMLGRNVDTYLQMLAERDRDGDIKPLSVYLPTYYQTLAARLYLSDGEAVEDTGPWVFETASTPARNGKMVELVVSSRHCASEAEAADYVAHHPGARLTVGCIDAGKSCVPLPAVKGLKRVFTSDPLPLSRDRAVRAVKIFEVMPE